MKLPYIKPRIFPEWMKLDPYQTESRYSLSDGGISAQFSEGSRLPHINHIEMSGFKASAIISYAVGQDLSLSLYRFCVFPGIRVNPNNTRGSLTFAFEGINICADEKVRSVFFNGILSFRCEAPGMDIVHRFVCACDKTALIEEVTILSDSDRRITFSNSRPAEKIRAMFTAKNEEIRLHSAVCLPGRTSESQTLSLDIHEGETNLCFVYSCEELDYASAKEQIRQREAFIAESGQRLDIETPDDEINQMLRLTKIRAGESIFKTKNGLMHSPGGGGYYAALWTNDQCEYANPFFACLGYDKAEEQSVNCYTLFSRLVKRDRALYTSIIAGGDGHWHGAGDRGDTSMYIYGLSRCLLTSGSRTLAAKFIVSLETAAEYVISQINDNGTVRSDSDELENRFESGKANLSTASISYDAFISLSYIERDLGSEEKEKTYLACAAKIKQGINTYFPKCVEGYDTYMYCEEEKNLRSWICLPLTVGIFDKADGTAKALMSDKLRTGSGILTRSGEKTYWDRTALYSMRGLFYAGKRDEGAELLRSYTHARLLGEHAPYPVEAFPEGNAAHLSAESALYQRIITEGILGYRPTGFDKFELKINMPALWDHIYVKRIKLCGKVTDIIVDRLSGDTFNIETRGLPAKKADANEAVEFIVKQ